jgi:hypothetical protein
MNVSQSCRKLLTTVPTTTRAFSGDVTTDRFAFLVNGFNRLNYLELHIYPLPGCTSSLPETGIVLRLKGMGRDVSRCYVPCRHKLKILRQSRGSTIAFLDERHIIVGNKIGLAAYDLCLDSLSDPIRLPYWTDFRPLSNTVHNSSHPTISVIYPTLPNGVVQCIIYTGSYVLLMNMPLPTSDLSTPVTQYFDFGMGSKRRDSAFSSTTVSVLGLSSRAPNPGHGTLVVRTNMEQGRGHVQLGCDRHEWIAAGVLLRNVANKWHVDISFDEDTGHALILSNNHTPNTDYSSDYSSLSLLSIV